MHVLRLFLKSGAQIELFYRENAAAREMSAILDKAVLPVRLDDHYGKSVVCGTGLDAWSVSDYAEELAGAVEIAWAKQQANEAHQSRVMARHGMIGQQRPQLRPNGIMHG